MQKQMCVRCVFDENINGISFNVKGLCNYCQAYDNDVVPLLKKINNSYELEKIVNEIKLFGKNQKYDCLIGLSGGVDSSFVAYNIHKLGLRPLAFHLDNGWNSDISVKNIKNIVSKLELELYTYVIDWEEFKDLQLSFIKAGVVDIELLTDHAITAVAYRLMKNEKIKYFISGSNYVTEAIMPNNWSYYKWDSKNIKAIHKKFGNKPLKTFPYYGFYDKIKSQSIFQVIRLLDYLDFNKNSAMEVLKDELGWEYYGGKHYESTFTKFYQAYILPKKFNIDKRTAHLSTLICSGQISKEDAMIELNKPLYDFVELERDIEYFLKKFGMTSEEFANILSSPPKSHLDYPNSVFFNNVFKIIKRFVRR